MRPGTATPLLEPINSPSPIITPIPSPNTSLGEHEVATPTDKPNTTPTLSVVPIPLTSTSALTPSSSTQPGEQKIALSVDKSQSASTLLSELAAPSSPASVLSPSTRAHLAEHKVADDRSKSTSARLFAALPARTASLSEHVISIDSPRAPRSLSNADLQIARVRSQYEWKTNKCSWLAKNICGFYPAVSRRRKVMQTIDSFVAGGGMGLTTDTVSNVLLNFLFGKHTAIFWFSRIMAYIVAVITFFMSQSTVGKNHNDRPLLALIIEALSDKLAQTNKKLSYTQNALLRVLEKPILTATERFELVTQVQTCTPPRLRRGSA